ncbi:unnamed protein product [marine sediment metagenome]|uniref:Uncharacterized protein n=1 Tax=marine sediment metagenome TaxID=412755 RepID=X1D6Y1_9ZZZZ
MKFEHTGYINGVSVAIAYFWCNRITLTLVILSFIFSIYVCCKTYVKDTGGESK